MSVPEIDKEAPSWLGIDIGQTCHLILGQGSSTHRIAVALFEEVPIKDLIPRVQELLATYNVIGGACDRYPYTPTADELYEEIPHSE